mmetsp:Transcript_6724/g.9764  ORF Transcript_6724/g.9764 Transcript_6724/m.9764 type:complete len:341 (-) Transcript_6724:38-1060(-)
MKLCASSRYFHIASPLPYFWLLLAIRVLLAPNSSAFARSTTPYPHVTWQFFPDNNGVLTVVEPRSFAEKECMIYLSQNLMSFDVPNAQSLGMHSTDDSLPDGLSNGIVGPTISIALDSKNKYPWTKHVPKDIFKEYVLNFSNVNEPRTNWRPLFLEALEPLLTAMANEDSTTVEQVVLAVNANIWDAFGKRIYFKSGQTPLLMDPMSVINFGYASCTGISIYLINALRTAGIPARLAGTPAWNGKVENGNHSWVEFYGTDGKWHIMESLPAAGSSPVDLLDPCQWWFCKLDKVKDTQFYAASLVCSTPKCYFPMAWDPENHCVPGERRTKFMRDLCSKCK